MKQKPNRKDNCLLSKKPPLNLVAHRQFFSPFLLIISGNGPITIYIVAIPAISTQIKKKLKDPNTPKCIK